jgi:hypothetical protein
VATLRDQLADSNASLQQLRQQLTACRSNANAAHPLALDTVAAAADHIIVDKTLPPPIPAAADVVTDDATNGNNDNNNEGIALDNNMANPPPTDSSDEIAIPPPPPPPPHTPTAAAVDDAHHTAAHELTNDGHVRHHDDTPAKLHVLPLDASKETSAILAEFQSDSSAEARRYWIKRVCHRVVAAQHRPSSTSSAATQPETDRLVCY